MNFALDADWLVDFKAYIGKSKRSVRAIRIAIIGEILTNTSRARRFPRAPLNLADTGIAISACKINKLWLLLLRNLANKCINILR